ncbi:MAG TPA: MarC family protein [Gemmatimonadaceae bacterium]|nr:MarC family protein [Gemmatimonadaceae bacterium]
MNGSALATALLAFTSLLAIVNPLSAVPIYVALTSDYDEAHRRATLRTAVLTGTLVLITFALLGTFILRFFGITTDAFRIAGGLIFLGIGSDMMAAKPTRVRITTSEEEEAGHRDEVGIIPLGLPTLAGPGAMTTVITLVAQGSSAWDQWGVYLAIVGVMGTAWLVLRVAPMLLLRLGRTGLNIITRVMGLLVMVIGVQFIINGVRAVVLDVLRAA